MKKLQTVLQRLLLCTFSCFVLNTQEEVYLKEQCQTEITNLEEEEGASGAAYSTFSKNLNDFYDASKASGNYSEEELDNLSKNLITVNFKSKYYFNKRTYKSTLKKLQKLLDDPTFRQMLLKDKSSGEKYINEALDNICVTTAKPMPGESQIRGV